MNRDDNDRKPVERDERLEKASRENREIANKEVIREDRQVVRDELPPVLPPEDTDGE